MRTKTQAAALAIASAGTLITGCALAAVFPGACLAWVIAGFVGYVACGRLAVALWRLNERVFDHPHKYVRASPARLNDSNDSSRFGSARQALIP
jgi:hypothetical protein